ncbi:hypothetical protein ACOSQ3_007435 [Xanthoceras sorbifolium]
MGALTCPEEFISSVVARRLFKALIIDLDNLLPELIPENFQSNEIIEGAEFKYLKKKVDAIDKEKMTNGYTDVDILQNGTKMADQESGNFHEKGVMGAFTYTDEYTSPVAPARLFKALIVDSHNLIPKLLPMAVKSIEIIEGDGGAGSIRQINFNEGSQVKCIKNRIDELDVENFSYKYSLIEGDGLMDKLEKVTYKVKFETTPDGGSKNKMTSTYYTKGDFVLTEEEIKEGKEKALGMYKVVESYLLQNPDAYA